MANAESSAAIYARARGHGAVFDLSARAKWRLRGADRIRYLNGQVTNDIRHLSGNTAMQACVTTAKGRLCGVTYISATPDFLRIDTEGALREDLAARLERYIVADDVTMEDATEEDCLFHVIAPEAPVISSAETRAANRYARPGHDVIAPMSERTRLADSLSENAVLLPAEIAETWRIEAGIPGWGAELDAETLPPEAGLDNMGVDYHKGCYIGQEVISRIKSVGHINRALTGFIAPGTLKPGMTLHLVTDPAKDAGIVTSATWSFGLETWAGLGYLKRAFADAPLLARDSDGRTVTVRTRFLPLVP